MRLQLVRGDQKTGGDSVRRIRRAVAAAGIALATIVMAARASVADSALLTAEVAGMSAPVRSGAPITIVWKLKSQSSNLLEGRLELRVKDGHERLARLVTDEIVLSTGEQLYRTVLPTLDTSNTMYAVEMELRFLGSRQTLDLGTQIPLRIPNAWQRAQVVAVSDPWQKMLTADKHAFVESFRLESYNIDSADRTITTSTAHIPPESMPADALAYFGFDIVLLINEGLTDLKEAQLQALARWVEAGGSLAVAPGRKAVRSEHDKFLSTLTGRSSESELSIDRRDPLSTTSEAPNAPASIGSAPILLKRFGLGRVAFISEPLESLGPEALPEMRRMLAFLWKMRHDRLDRFVANSIWVASPPAPSEVEAADPNLPPSAALAMVNQIRPPNMQLAPLALQTGDQLLARLMPRNLRVLPLWQVAILLFMYVLVIGPGDYWLLGSIKRRRYTWVLFPAVTIAFAIGTVALSNRYMRVADNRRNVTFVDIGDSGRIVRRNRFDLLFRGVHGESVTDMRRGFLAAMNHQQFMRGSWYNYQIAMRQGNEDQLDLVEIPEYRGRVPTRYAVSQSLPQWTPQLNRLCWLADDESEPAIAFDWKSLADLNITAPNNLIGDDARRQIVQAVQRSFGDDAGIYVVAGGQLRHVAGPSGVLQRDDPQFSGTENVAYQPAYYALHQQAASTFLIDVCTGASQGGMFNVVSQISPHGGNNFEDMVLVDPSDPRQWLLIVTVDRGDELVVYRKLYTGE